MPLQDAFKKKTHQDTKAESFKVAPLRRAPSIEDLKFCMEQSRKQIGRPSALSWVTDTDTYILTATHSQGTYEPTWILHVGSETMSAIAWRHSSSDCELVHNLLEQVKPPDLTKAEIPDFLKPVTDEERLANAQAPLPHDEFSSKCEIISRLGFGGMGVIYKAKRKETGDIVALKVLHGHLMDEEENLERFKLEAQACLDLKHRNLINVHEFGVSKHGQPYMVMEYLEGEPLTDIIAQGCLDIPRFINLFLQICDGLRFAHEKNVVHRDVKPSNIMVLRTAEGQETAKVLDFGIAKVIVETNQSKLTPTGNIVGSPAYISPEQAAGGKADPKIDVYSLGCVMYEALAGHPPFVHESSIQVLMAQLGDPPPPLSSVVPEGAVPPKLEQIIMRCLEKNPDKRYPSAADLGADLFVFATSRSRAHQGSSELDVQVARKNQSTKVTQPIIIPSKHALTIRLRHFRGNAEMDSVWEGLSLALRIQSRDLQVSILLDQEACHLVHRPDVFVSRMNLDAQTTKRISSLQSLLQQLIKGGALVFASERWVKRGNDESRQLMPGVVLINDEEVCDFILERSGSIVDY